MVNVTGKVWRDQTTEATALKIRVTTVAVALWPALNNLACFHIHVNKTRA